MGKVVATRKLVIPKTGKLGKTVRIWPLKEGSWASINKRARDSH